eukprot:14484575-Alexandrium_andersonii.AAC.1
MRDILESLSEGRSHHALGQSNVGAKVTHVAGDSEPTVHTPILRSLEAGPHAGARGEAHALARRQNRPQISDEVDGVLNTVHVVSQEGLTTFFPRGASGVDKHVVGQSARHRETGSRNEATDPRHDDQPQE